MDIGGVIVRTADRTSRLRLAERLGLTYDQLIAEVFDSPSSAQASLGRITTAQHWASVMDALSLPPDQADAVRREFFAGDIVDGELVSFLRGLRGRVKTGLISNAWPDLREYILREGFADAFDEMIISAEVGLMKPDARIYRLALERLGVPPHEAVFVDDMPKNVEAAQALGMHGILFRDTAQTLDQIRKLL